MQRESLSRAFFWNRFDFQFAHFQALHKWHFFLKRLENVYIFSFKCRLFISMHWHSSSIKINWSCAVEWSEIVRLDHGCKPLIYWSVSLRVRILKILSKDALLPMCVYVYMRFWDVIFSELHQCMIAGKLSVFIAQYSALAAWWNLTNFCSVFAVFFSRDIFTPTHIHNMCSTINSKLSFETSIIPIVSHSNIIFDGFCGFFFTRPFFRMRTNEFNYYRMNSHENMFSILNFMLCVTGTDKDKAIPF